MGVASCLAVVKHPAGSNPQVTRARLEGLRRFYAPLGTSDLNVHEPFGGVLLAEIEFDALDGGRGRGGAPPLTPEQEWLAGWGGPFPRQLIASPAETLHAPDEALRAIRGFGALVVATGTRAALITSAVGPTALYAAQHDGLMVWATHAVAAAWLCRGQVKLSPEALPEFLVTEFVGGERTHLDGVSAVGAAQRIDIGPEHVASRGYWPLRDRWAPSVAERDAQRAGERALLEAVDDRLTGCDAPLMGLTAGKDSRVVALAMRETGREFSSMTWGDLDSPDVAGARRVAACLGVAHAIYGYRWRSDEETRAAITAGVVWSDGLEPAHGLAMPLVPQRPSAIVTGRGGETARAFFYRLGARYHVRPTKEELVATFLDHRPDRLGLADPHATECLRNSIGRWLDAASLSGHKGWRLLDVVYAEERLRRWDRTRLMRQRSLYIPAFDDLAVQRALISLPLADRLSDEFHRAFVAARDPRLVPERAEGQRRGVPGPLRRVMRALRRRRGPATSPSPVRAPLASRWAAVPRTREWFAEELLVVPELSEAFGESFVTEVRRGFLEGEAAATRSALVLAAPAALSVVATAELRELPPRHRDG